VYPSAKLESIRQAHAGARSSKEGAPMTKVKTKRARFHYPYFEDVELRVVESLDGKEVEIYEVIYAPSGKLMAWSPFGPVAAKDVAGLRFVNRKLRAALEQPVLKLTKTRRPTTLSMSTGLLSAIKLVPKRAARATARRKGARR
jgi:hypothetical protein